MIDFYVLDVYYIGFTIGCMWNSHKNGKKGIF